MKKSQLAQYLGKSRAYVTRLERGDIQPRLEVALRIARHFEQPVEDIFHLPDAACRPALPGQGLAAPASETHSHSNFSVALRPPQRERTNKKRDGQ